MTGEILLLPKPLGSLVGQEIAQGRVEGCFRVGKVSSPNGPKELKIAFLLSGDEMMNEHGTACGQ